MDERLHQLLAHVVEDVIRTGEPVGSQSIVEAHGLDVSSATVRNWFAELEAQGHLMQPHTSGGRLPTEKGYQLYVERLMGRRPLGRKDRAELERVAQSVTDPERRLKALAKCTAEGLGVATVLGLNEADTFYTGLSQLFAQPEFRDWRHVVGLGEILDQLDDVLARVRRERFALPATFIGATCPFGSMCGAVLLSLPDGGLVGIFGPMRMDYRSAIAYLEAIKDLSS